MFQAYTYLPIAITMKLFYHYLPAVGRLVNTSDVVAYIAHPYANGQEQDPD